MIYMFVKISNKWYGRKIADYEMIDGFEREAREHLHAHINHGDIVTVCNNIKSFTEEMGIEEKDIKMVE